MTKDKNHKAPLPTKEQVRTFIEESTRPVGKREVARAFSIKGSDRIYLKKILKELMSDGVIERGEKKELTGAGSLPSVAVVDVTSISSDGEPVAVPVNWSEDAAQAPPKIYIRHDRKSTGPAPGVGDRLLARLGKLADGDYEGRIIRRLTSQSAPVLGVYTKMAQGGQVKPTNRKIKKEVVIADGNSMGAKSGEVVICDILPGRSRGLPEGRVTQRIGPMQDARSLSLIAIHAHGIPDHFSEKTLNEAKNAKPAKLGKRNDLRDIPIVTIDPVDARDRDDAVWAAPDDDAANEGGFQIIVAIADVANYVTPGSALDQSALKRGNSVYFPDRVVPMLPEELSTDLCSLHDNVDRPVMAVHMWFDKDGNKLRHKFMRALIRSQASFTYAQVQAARDGHADDRTAPFLDGVINPLFDAYEKLKVARDRRAPLNLDLPERRVEFNDDGFIKSVHKKVRLDAHMLIEEFMIQANVSAAEELKRKKQPCMYRVHEEPSREKLSALGDVLNEMEIPFARGQVMDTKVFNRILGAAEGHADRELVSTLVLRSQSQAVYSPENLHHFGLHLSDYAHFTSPIRRYADLLVHRSLIHGLKLGDDGLTAEEAETFPAIGEQISALERRAMVAERETMDRFTTVFLAGKVGEYFPARISGVTRAGLFVALDDTGADGLIPISTIGNDYFLFDEGKQSLIGERSGTRYRLGDRLTVRLGEADIVTGSMIMQIAGDGQQDGKDLKLKGRPRKKAALAPKSRKKTKKKTTPKAERRKIRDQKRAKR